MSKSGAAAVEISSDVFHDNFDQAVENLRGWPDAMAGKSLVEVLTRTVTINKPSGVSGNWDCHVVMTPIDTPLPVIKCYESGTLEKTGLRTGRDNESAPAGFAYAAKAEYPYGGLMVMKAASGSSLTLAATTNECYGPWSSSANAYDVTPVGAYRLIAGGFEIRNTTAELYKQGAVTVWKDADPIEKVNFTITKAQASDDFPQLNFVPVLADVHRYPPINSSQALLIPGSLQWRASEGAYVNCPLIEVDNPALRSVDSQLVIWNEQKTEEDLGALFANPVYGTDFVQAPFGSVSVPFHRSRLMTSGAFFTGLSEQSTLTLTYRFVVEYFPSLQETTLRPLAKTCAAYDPLALQYYSQIVQLLPTYTQVGNNASGDFFRNVFEAMKTVAKVGLPLLKPVIQAKIPGSSEFMQGVEAALNVRKTAAKTKKKQAKAAKKQSEPSVLSKKEKAKIIASL